MSQNIEKVAVLGAGVMGAQIAGHLANAGIPSLLFDINQELAEKGVEILQNGGWTATDWGSHAGGGERAVSPTGLKGPGGTSVPSDMLLYADRKSVV